MTGYFSKIVKQSGARLAGESRGPTKRIGQPPAPQPIEREEIVMVPSTARSIPDRGADPAKAREGAHDGNPNPMAPVDREVPSALEATPNAESAAIEVRPSGGEANVSPDREARAITRHQSPRIELPDAKAENVDREALETRELSQPSSEKEAKTHFVETAKIISGRDVPKEKASAILMHELHEWIAAGTEIETPNDVAPEFTSAVVDGKVESDDKPEPGVVRILGEAVSKKAPDKQVARDTADRDNESIREETLDLSIGSINVVIEGDAAPPVIQPPPTRSITSTESSPVRPSSRLRRNYI